MEPWKEQLGSFLKDLELKCLQKLKAASKENFESMSLSEEEEEEAKEQILS